MAVGCIGPRATRLPEPPRDFNAVVTHYLNTGTPDESFFSPKYYLQPEFYPSFIGSGLGYWTAPSTTHWAAYGYGSFPVRKTVDAAVGEKSAVTFFVHSGYGVRSWQGMGFRTIVSGDGNAIITIAPSEILLGPSFPSFTAAWAGKITVGITPESAGSYNVKVFASAPLEASSQKWSADSSARGMQYFDAGFAGTEIPLIEIAVEAK